MERVPSLSRRRIDQAHGPVLLISHGQQPAVGAEGRRRNRTGNAGKLAERLSRGDIPDDHPSVVTGRIELPSVGSEGNAGDQPGMADARKLVLMGLGAVNVPESQGAVVASGDELPA